VKEDVCVISIQKMVALERRQWGQVEEYNCRPLCVRISFHFDRWPPKAAGQKVCFFLHPVGGFHVK